jgi:hypothetical protein
VGAVALAPSALERLRAQRDAHTDALHTNTPCSTSRGCATALLSVPVKRFVVAIGIVFVIAGFGVSGTTLSAVDHGTTVKCGDAWDDLGHGDADRTDIDNRMKHDIGGYGDVTDFVDKCESKKTIYKVLGLVLGIIGLGLLVGGAFIPGRKPEAATQQADKPSEKA